jgi:serine phosphatase RsbU (regulator of sigma subunit)
MSRLDELATAMRKANAEYEAADEAVKNLELELEEARKVAREKLSKSVACDKELFEEAAGRHK